jgi:hypothetical protein
LDYLCELHAHPWVSFVGGLSIREGDISPGPLIVENFWQTANLERYWADSRETLKSLNPVLEAGFLNYVGLTIGCLKRYIRAIEKHPSLAPCRDMIPRISAFVETIQEPANAEKLNPVTYVLAHKALHFGNIMCNRPSRLSHNRDFGLGVQRRGTRTTVESTSSFSLEYQNIAGGQGRAESHGGYLQGYLSREGLQKMLDEMQLDPLQDSMRAGLWLITFVQLSKYVQEGRLRTVWFTEKGRRNSTGGL